MRTSLVYWLPWVRPPGKAWRGRPAVFRSSFLILCLCLANACLGATAVQVRIAAGTDDAEEWSGTGGMYVNSTDLELAIDGTTSNTVGMRFTSLAIPQGATITNAYIQFKTDEATSNSCSLTLRGQAADNAASFTWNTGDISTRATTTASVAWSPSSWSTVGEAGSNQRTPNLSTIIQEIVNRSGWSAGNSLAIIITGSGTRNAEAYEGDSAGAALLYVEYSFDSPVGNWKLGESSGTTAIDSSVFAQHGTVSGTASWSTRCNSTGVFEFDGSANYIYASNSSHLQPHNGLTIAGWIRGDYWGAGTDNDTILRKGEANPNNYALAISDGRVELILDGYDGSGFRGNTILPTGEWHHVAATWDGSTVRIYVNGVLDNTPATRTGTIGTDSQAIYIGGRSGADFFDGMLQEVCLYNRALSAGEVARLAGMAGHWRFSEGTGTTAADSSGGGNNAGLLGGATWTTDCAGSNNALLTDGVGGIARTAAAFSPPDVGTVAFWMRSSGSPAGTARLFGVGGDWEVRQISDGTLAFDLCGEAGTNFVTTSPVSEADRWYHVAATFNSADDSYAVYVDGQLQKSGTNTYAMVKQTAAKLSFGTRTGSTEYWQGALRDVRVYSRLLCPLEIAELYGLIGHWKLDETSGSSVADASMFGNTSPLIGTPDWTTGKVDGAHRFAYADGNDYVTIVNSTLLDNVQEGSYSLAAWFKPLTTPPGTGSANDANYAILVKAGYHCGLSYSNSQQFGFGHYLAGNIWTGTDSSPSTYPTGRFYHVVAVVDRPSGTIKLYVDGELKNTAGFTANSAAREYGSEAWRIGIAHPMYSSWRWAAHAVIDDVRIYNRTLCPAEIDRINGQGFGGVRIIKWVEIQ